MRRLLAGALIVVALFVSSITTVFAGDVKMFPTEAAARLIALEMSVVWLNVPTHIYHEKGMRWYGRTKNGAYVCRAEADGAGDRDTRKWAVTTTQTCASAE